MTETLRADAVLADGAPVLTADEMREWDRRTIELHGVPESVLMEAAGRAAASVLQRHHPEGRVVAAVGRGNNGGDALVLLRTLSAWGRDVAAVLVNGDSEHRALLHGWAVPLLPRDEAESAFGSAAVLVDGLLGTGARGAPHAEYAAMIRALNASGRPVVALDGPSGVDLSDGTVAGEVVDAELTIAFAALKRGHLLWPGRRHCGRIVVVEIGLAPPAAPVGARLVTPAWARRRVGEVPADAHKGTMGEVVVVAGSTGVAGAAALAGTGAARGGAGKVWLASAGENRVVLQTLLPEALFVEVADPRLQELLGRADAVLAGPGIGTGGEALELCRTVLSTGDAPVVLDADALTLLATSAEMQRLVRRRPVLLTPHPGEMGRLLEVESASVAADPIGHATAAAARFGAAVLLKGFPSLVARADGSVLVNAVRASGVATGGMGDTLGGVIAAFLACGLEAADAGAAALFYTGRAAEMAGLERALLPRDVADLLGRALAERPERTGGAPGVLLDLPAAR
jgi:ADP-dependent NAD(P)H-hydrate dehydratase / NAD(P)H-hydrate epimerase